VSRSAPRRRGRKLRRGRVAGIGAVIGAWIALSAPTVAASTAPLSPGPVFAQREVVDPLVVAAGIDSFAGFDGTNLQGWTETTGLSWSVHIGAMVLQTGAVELDATPLAIATLPTAFSNVLVRADLELPGADRAAGVVLNRGLAGQLNVLVEHSGADQRVALYFDDGISPTLLVASTPTGGLPAGVGLVVESRDGVVRAWLDGAPVIDHTLAGPSTGVVLQQDHGIVLAHPGDRVAAVRILAPA
jgi:hypothetical protein